MRVQTGGKRLYDSRIVPVAMDTANDARLATAERALADLQESLQHGHIKAQFPKDEAMQALDEVASSLKALKYTYAEPEALVEMDPFKDLQGAAARVEKLLGGPSFHEEIDEKPLAVAQARWALDTVATLEERLLLPGKPLDLAVEARKGRVLSTREHPKADELLVTRVGAGRGLTVVTNDASVAKDDEVGIALLPPTDLRGVVSEGMFLGDDDGVLTGVAEDDDGRPDVPPEAFSETRNHVSAYLDRD